MNDHSNLSFVCALRSAVLSPVSGQGVIFVCETPSYRFGYKNHVNADAKHKLIRHYAVTGAALHDSQELDGLLGTGNTCDDVFADSAYRLAKIEFKCG